MAKRIFSLSGLIASSFGAYAILLIITFGLFVNAVSTSALEDAQHAQLDRIAMRVGRLLDRELSNHFREIKVAAAGRTIASSSIARDEKRESLDQLKALMPAYTWLGLTDQQGVLVAATDRLGEGQDMSRRPWFEAGRAGAMVLETHPATMPRLYSPQSTDPLRLIDVVAPVYEGGQFKGVLAAHVGRAWLESIRQTILGSANSSTDLLILDRYKTVIFGPAASIGATLDVDANSLARNEVSAKDTTQDYATSTIRSAVSEGYEQLQWFVVAREPVQHILAPIYGARRDGIAGALLIGAVFLLIGIGIASYIGRPIRVLAVAATRLSSDSDAEIPIVSSYREVTTLAEALRSAVHVLQGKKQELFELNADLERQIASRTRDLVAAKETAEAATRAKTDFLANMSHEVRTPLGGIIGFADLLLEDPTLTPVQRRRIDQIQGAGALLAVVINDILDFSKIEAGKIELEPKPFLLRTAIENCAALLAPKADESGIALTVEIGDDLPACLLGDETRLRQVLINLLSNAVKFTRRGGVKLTVSRCTEGGPGLLCFAVIDTGIGIAPEKVSRLFQRFSQVDNSIAREFGGTGLGLAISQRLIGLMGSQIDVESLPGVGSKFAFTLALPEAELVDTNDAADDGATIGGLHLLLAEDVATNQEIIVAILQGAGHDVDVVADGQAAIEVAAVKSYDVILMDIQMPGTNGVSATRSIRSRKGPNAATPILAMTANVLPEQIATYKAAGMNDHLGKPIIRRELLRKVALHAPRHKRETLRIVSDTDETVLELGTADDLVTLLGEERVQVFFADLASRLTQLATVDTPAVDDLGEMAHKLVGIAGTLGFYDLAESCRTLQDACDGGDAVEGRLAAVLDQIPTVLRDIARWGRAHDLAMQA